MLDGKHAFQSPSLHASPPPFSLRFSPQNHILTWKFCFVSPHNQCERIPIYATDDEYDEDEDDEDEDDDFDEDPEPDIEDWEIKLKLERLRHSGGTAHHLLDVGC
jgi:hypothetical protein